MLTAKVHIFSDSVFFTGSGALGLTGARMKSGNCTNRNDIAGPSIETGWHVCLGDTTVQILQRIKSFMSENGHEPFNFLDGLVFVSMFNDISNWKCLEEQANVQLKREKWLLTQQASEMVIGVSVVQDLKRHGKIADRSCHHFAEDEWEKLALRMISEFMFSKHLVLKYSNMFQNKCVDETKERRRWSWNSFQKRARKSSHARGSDSGVQSTLSVLRSAGSDPEQDASSDSCFHHGIASGRNRSVCSPKKPHVCGG